MAKKGISKKINKVVQNYVQRLIKEDNLLVENVFIFGSQVKGKAHKWSDIDVCIISPKFKDHLKALEYLWAKRRDDEVRHGLEPIGFSRKDFKAGSGLIKEIKRTGIKLDKKISG